MGYRFRSKVLLGCPRILSRVGNEPGIRPINVSSSLYLIRYLRIIYLDKLEKILITIEETYLKILDLIYYLIRIQ